VIGVPSDKELVGGSGKKEIGAYERELFVWTGGVMVGDVLRGENAVPDAELVECAVVEGIAFPLGAAELIVVISKIFQMVQRTIGGTDEIAVEV